MKTGFLIPIRLGSERLPNKALRQLRNRTVLENLIRRVRLSRYASRGPVIICTTNRPEEAPLVALSTALGLEVFKGSEDDIIDRFYRAARHYELDAVIQIDGDDPCTDPQYMDLCMDRLLSDTGLGIVHCEGLPLGLASKAFRYSALETVFRKKLDAKNDTGFIYYFTRAGLFPKDVIRPVSPDHVHNEARLTLDYPEDLEFFEQLLSLAEPTDDVATIDALVRTLRLHPHLLEINGGLNERYWARTKELLHLRYQDDEGEKTIEF